MTTLFKHIVMGQVWMESEVSSQDFESVFLQLVSFTVDGEPLWPTRCVDRNISHVIFSHVVCTFNYMHITLRGSRRATQCVCSAHSLHPHAIHDVCWSVRCLSLRVSSPMSTASRERTAAPSHNEEHCSMAIYHPPTPWQDWQRSGSMCLPAFVWRYGLINLQSKKLHPNRHSNKHWSHSIQYKEFWLPCYAVCLWGQWSGNQNDHQNDYQRSKSHNCTCFKNPQSLFGLVVCTTKTSWS